MGGRGKGKTHSIIQECIKNNGIMVVNGENMRKHLKDTYNVNAITLASLSKQSPIKPLYFDLDMDIRAITTLPKTEYIYSTKCEYIQPKKIDTALYIILRELSLADYDDYFKMLSRNEEYLSKFTAGQEFIKKSYNDKTTLATVQIELKNYLQNKTY